MVSPRPIRISVACCEDVTKAKCVICENTNNAMEIDIYSIQSCWLLFGFGTKKKSTRCSRSLYITQSERDERERGEASKTFAI